MAITLKTDKTEFKGFHILTNHGFTYITGEKLDNS